ncbi:hypothetical protein [Nocardioides sp. 616]|uniref:hypothetical protein n=1 Tax=Nocardioides sp. 616 TaxID=2268090 RepID=UPI0013B47104|nr:hypothetical protein [Nocardioides sp. 616]
MSSEPSSLPRAVEQGLRGSVLALKAHSPRGHLEPRLWAGLPGQLSDTGAGPVHFDPRRDEPLDRHTRVEVAVALGNRALESHAAPVLWLTRSGDTELCPADLDWLSAGDAAWRELGLTPSFALVTRHGWVHHPTVRSRTWRRLRR